MSGFQDEPAPQQPPLQTISSFARSVGLSVSALRSYGENGLLVPAEVDEWTGYRYYTPAQGRRAIWIRRLRGAGFPLGRIRELLDGTPEVSEQLLDEWLRDSRARTLAAEQVVADLRNSLYALRADDRQPLPETRARLDAEVLAAAIGQVRAASGRPGDATGLDGVLLDLAGEGVGVVATDRYLLLSRTGLPAAVTGPGGRAQVRPGPLEEWLVGRAEIDLVLDRPTTAKGRTGTRVVLQDTHGEVLNLEPDPDRFPDLAQVLEADAVRVSRIVVARQRLAAAARGHDQTGRPVFLSANGDMAVFRMGSLEVRARHQGDPVELQLSSAVLATIAENAVGRDLVCEIRANGRPLLWRSPQQPDFAALAMPVA